MENSLMTSFDEFPAEKPTESLTWAPRGREAKIMDNKIDVFLTSIKTVEDLVSSLIIEVAEMSAIRTSLKKEIQEALENKIMSLAPEFAKAISHSVNQQTKQSANTICDIFEKLKREAKNAEQFIQDLVDKEKTRFIKWSISLVGTSLLSCFVVSAGLFYFFPQHQYVTFEMTYEQAKQILIGRSFLNNLTKLKSEDRNLIIGGIQFDIEDMMDEARKQ